MKTLLLSLLLLAQVETDAKRYHDAYVLEVIEGKTADAAKAYLALMQDESATKRLRLQAEFRFAVCAALLGRADEARARLARLKNDPDLPDDLKPQIDEYHGALSKVGAGTALDEKLRDLTLSLANVSATSKGAPSAYREFAVLGDAAVPYLRSLLTHPDREIRRHAWRILLQMDAPDLAAEWNSQMGGSEDFQVYLGRNSDQVRVFESRLRELPPRDIPEQLARYWQAGEYSLQFCKWLVEQDEGFSAAYGIMLLAQRPLTRETEALVLGWLKDGSATQQRAAARHYGAWAKALGPSPEAVALFPRFVTAYLQDPFDQVDGVAEYARVVPIGARIDALGATIDAERGARLSHAYKLLFGSFSSAIADSIQEGAKEPGMIARYRELVVRWCEAIGRRDGWGRLPSDSALPRQVRWVVVHSSAEDANSVVRLIGRERLAQARMVSILGFERAEDAPLIAAAAETWDMKHVYGRVVQSVQPEREPDSGYFTAVARLWPLFLDEPFSTMHDEFVALAPRLHPADARRIALDILRAERARGGQGWPRTIVKLFPPIPKPNDSQYARTVAFPVLPEAWDMAPSTERITLLNFAIAVLRLAESPAGVRDEAADFVVRHLPEINATVRFHVRCGDLVNHPERIAPERWIPHVSQSHWTQLVHQTPPEPAFLVEAVRGFAAHPEHLNENAIWFLRMLAPEEEVSKMSDSLYETADDSVLARLAGSELPGSAEIREKRLLRYLNENESPNVTVVARLARSLAETRPSPALFPVVEWLLRKKERDALIVAVDVAGSLGSEKLVPNLLPLLDSLDKDIRVRAKETIDGILENRRIKAEVESKIALGNG